MLAALVARFKMRERITRMLSGIGFRQSNVLWGADDYE